MNSTIEYKVGDTVRVLDWEQLHCVGRILDELTDHDNGDKKGYYFRGSSRWIEEGWLGKTAKILKIQEYNNGQIDYLLNLPSYFIHVTSSEYFTLVTSVSKTMTTE